MIYIQQSFSILILAEASVINLCKAASENIALSTGKLLQEQENLPSVVSYEPRREKTGLRGFRPGLTQTNLYSHRKELEA